MFDTSPLGLRALVSQGESDTVELRSHLPRDHSIADTISAFANTSGGILIVGVSDDLQVIGLSDDEITQTIARLQDIARSVLPGPFDLSTVEIDGQQVAVLVVNQAEPQFRPVTNARGEVWIRRNGSSVKSESEMREKVAVRDRSLGFANRNDNTYVAFLAMSFRDEQEPSLVDYYEAIKRAVQRVTVPIELHRMDLIEGDYDISQGLMDAIEQADLIIGDFTLSPANVYFEVGYARGCKKHIIQTARKGTVLEFDIRNWRTLLYRNATELEAKLVLELDASLGHIVKARTSPR
jgi:hypothetical protein